MSHHLDILRKILFLVYYNLTKSTQKKWSRVVHGLKTLRHQKVKKLKIYIYQEFYTETKAVSKIKEQEKFILSFPVFIFQFWETEITFCYSVFIAFQLLFLFFFLFFSFWDYLCLSIRATVNKLDSLLDVTEFHPYTTCKVFQYFTYSPQSLFNHKQYATCFYNC